MAPCHNTINAIGQNGLPLVESAELSVLNGDPAVLTGVIEMPGSQPCKYTLCIYSRHSDKIKALRLSKSYRAAAPGK